MKRETFFHTLTQRLIDSLILLVLAVAAVIALTGLLFLIKTGWGLYQSTVVGEHYLNRQGVPELVQFAFSVNIFVLATQTIVITLGVTLSIGVLSRFLGFSSHLYIHKALPVRIFLWGFPIAWLTALTLQETGIHHDLLILFFLGLLPALCLMDRTFGLVNQIVPEVEMLLARYTVPARVWEILSRCLSLIFVSTVLSVMTLYLLSAWPQFQIDSPSWGGIPVDLTPLGLVEVAFTLSFTVFCVCAVPAVFAQLLHAVKSLYLPLPGLVKFLVCGPLFLFASAMGIRYFNHMEPFGGAIVLAVVPTFSIYHALPSQLPDMIPQMGELVCRMDCRVKHPVDLSGVFKWLGGKLNLN